MVSTYYVTEIEKYEIELSTSFIILIGYLSVINALKKLKKASHLNHDLTELKETRGLGLLVDWS
jgi:hypothetical protein